jgi:photosystem II stability/assembly factor-like uncharacterized protein
MRWAVVGVALVALLAAPASSAGRKPPASRLVPNAVAFRDPLHGVLGSGWEGCVNRAWNCRPSGAISVTADGGRTWTVVRRTARPVVSLLRDGDAYVATLDDGERLRSAEGGRVWRPSSPSTGAGLPASSVCPQGMLVGANAGAGDWSLCTTEGGAGDQGKSVYRNLPDRGWVRVAWTGLTSTAAQGGISAYGYPLGIAGNDDGFGLIWESRGTLYVTRDGGRDWQALPKVVRPELDFGFWAFVLPRGGVGWEVVGYQGTERRRLIETTDAGRTWRVVHRWACRARRQRCGDVAGPP